MTADLTTILQKESLSGEDTAALVKELRSRGTTLRRLLQINYMIPLINEDIPEDIVSELNAAGVGDEVAPDAGTEFGELIRNGILSVGDIATGLSVGSYDVLIDGEESSYHRGIDRTIKFARRTEGQEPLIKGQGVCRLAQQKIVYDSGRLATLQGLLQKIDQLPLGAAPNTRVPSPRIVDLYNSLPKGGYTGDSVPDGVKEVLVGIAHDLVKATTGDTGAQTRDASGRANAALLRTGVVGGRYDMNAWLTLESTAVELEEETHRRSSAYRYGSLTDESRAVLPWILDLLGVTLETDFEAEAEAFEKRCNDDLAHHQLALFNDSGDSYGAREYEVTRFTAYRMHVLTVQEAGEYRVASCVTIMEDTEVPSSLEYQAILCHNSWPLYDNLDVGNILFSNGMVSEPGVTWNAQALNTLVRVTRDNNTNRQSLRVDRAWYTRNILPVMRRENLNTQSVYAQRLKSSRLKDKLGQLADEESTRTNTTISGIKFTKTGMSFQDVAVEIQPTTVFQAWLKAISPTDVSGIEFNDVFQSLVESSLGYYDGNIEATSPLRTIEGGTVTIQVNNITAQINLALTARDYDRLTINGNRINKKEIVPVILRMMCFQEQGQFDTFVAAVRKCSLRIMNFLANGVEFPVLNPLTQQPSTGLIRLIRKGSKNFIRLKGKGPDDSEVNEDVRVRNINRLLSLGESTGRGRYRVRNISDTVKALSVSTDLTLEQMRVLMRGSVRAYIEAIRRSEALLTSTMEKFSVTHVSTPTTALSGEYYKIPAQSGQTYYIQDDSKLGIYDNNGNYICIVDKGAAMQNTVGRDRLIARIYAIACDKQTVADIHTLQTYIGNN